MDGCLNLSGPAIYDLVGSAPWNLCGGQHPSNKARSILQNTAFVNRRLEVWTAAVESRGVKSMVIGIVPGAAAGVVVAAAPAATAATVPSGAAALAEADLDDEKLPQGSYIPYIYI